MALGLADSGAHIGQGDRAHLRVGGATATGPRPTEGAIVLQSVGCFVGGPVEGEDSSLMKHQSRTGCAPFPCATLVELLHRFDAQAVASLRDSGGGRRIIGPVLPGPPGAVEFPHQIGVGNTTEQAEENHEPHDKGCRQEPLADGFPPAFVKRLLNPLRFDLLRDGLYDEGILLELKLLSASDDLLH